MMMNMQGGRRWELIKTFVKLPSPPLNWEVYPWSPVPHWINFDGEDETVGHNSIMKIMFLDAPASLEPTQVAQW